MDYTFDQLNDAVQDCTGYSLMMKYDEDEELPYYHLVDAYGDNEGDPFYELEDVYYFIMDNEDIAQYLGNLAN